MHQILEKDVTASRRERVRRVGLIGVAGKDGSDKSDFVRQGRTGSGFREEGSNRTYWKDGRIL